MPEICLPVSAAQKKLFDAIHGQRMIASNRFEAGLRARHQESGLYRHNEKVPSVREPDVSAPKTSAERAVIRMELAAAPSPRAMAMIISATDVFLIVGIVSKLL